MSCQFKADTFNFNGIDFSEKYGIYLVSTGDNNNDENINGQTVTISDEIDTGDIKSFAKITREYVDIPITICKIEDNTIIPMEDRDLDELNMELFQTKYCPFVVNDLIINCIIIKSTSFFNSAKQGYINLTLHCEPYYRSFVITKEVAVAYAKEIILENRSNINEDIYVNIDIYIDSTNTNKKQINIKNLTNGSEIELYLDDNKQYNHIMVYGEYNGVPMNYVKLDGSDINMISKMTVRKWIKLSYGVNKIYITGNDYNSYGIETLTGNRIIKFTYQDKIMFR